MQEAAPIALKSCADWLREHGAPALVRFVFITDAGFAAYATALDKLSAATQPLTPAPVAPPQPATDLLSPTDDRIDPFFTTEDPL